MKHKEGGLNPDFLNFMILLNLRRYEIVNVNVRIKTHQPLDLVVPSPVAPWRVTERGEGGTS